MPSKQRFYEKLCFFIASLIASFAIVLSLQPNMVALDGTHSQSIEMSENDLSQDQAFREFTNAFFVNEVSSNTLGLHYTLENPESYNITDVEITLGDFSTDTDTLLASIENYENQIASFDYDQLSAENQLTYDILLHYFSTEKDFSKYLVYEEPLKPYIGLHSQLPVLLSEYPLQTEEDIIIYLQLLETIPDYFDSLMKFEEEKSHSGLFMSNDRLEQVLSECNVFISMETNYMLSTFESRISTIPDITPEHLTHYIDQNQAVVRDFVIPAYQDLMDSLESLTGTGNNTQGLCYYEGGLPFYSMLAQTSIGTSRTIPEISDLIEAQLLSDMEAIQSALADLESHPDYNFDTDINEFVYADRSPEEILDILQTRMEFTFPPAADVTASIKEVPSELEGVLSPAFYLIPAIDNPTENTIYLNPAQMTDPLTLYTTLAHEGYPGHLYQTTYYTTKNPDPLRSLLDFGGYVEGWATYTEMTSYYLSDLPSELAKLYQSNASLSLGLYARADIGIHYEGWTLEDTSHFFQTYGISDIASIKAIYDLVIATPTNYLKYYVGYLEILELKKECISTWGEDFSQIRFHTELLEIGPAPFDIIRNQLLDK